MALDTGLFSVFPCYTATHMARRMRRRLHATGSLRVKYYGGKKLHELRAISHRLYLSRTGGLEVRVSLSAQLLFAWKRRQSVIEDAGAYKLPYQSTLVSFLDRFPLSNPNQTVSTGHATLCMHTAI